MYGPSKNWILERTVGLYARTETGDPIMAGSGVLLRIADVAFVLSAGHVLKAMRDMGILISPMANGSQLIRPGELDVIASEGHSEIDAGFIRLFPKTVEALAIHRKFLTMADLAIGTTESKPNYYCFLGYPQQLNTPDYLRKRIDARPLCYLTPSVVESHEATPGISVLLDVTKDTVILSDSESSKIEEQRMPHLKGISGCGIWRLDRKRERMDPSGDAAGSAIRLVGIEYAWAPRKWVKGVLIHHVIGLIVDAYPDLRPCIQLTL
jgi:hypothetical protein